MNRYLTEEQLKFNLQFGKGVEQWLSSARKEDCLILKWLRIDKERNGVYSVAYFESFDEGDGDFLDLYEFSQVNPDEPFGVIHTFQSIEEALMFSLVAYGTSNARYVSAGMIQEEYRDYLNK